METSLYQIKLVSLISKILSEGTFSRVVAQMYLSVYVLCEEPTSGLQAVGNPRKINKTFNRNPVLQVFQDRIVVLILQVPGHCLNSNFKHVII